MSPVGYCRDAAALLVLRRTADAVAVGEHVLNAARLRRVLGNNTAFCSSRCDTDAVNITTSLCENSLRLVLDTYRIYRTYRNITYR